MFAHILPSFLLAFPALFSIVNPIGSAFIYARVTDNRSHAERIRLAWMVAFYSAIVMLSTLCIGALLLKFYGISISALRIAGGLIAAQRGWEMLFEPEHVGERKQHQAEPAHDASDVAFFPLTMPFTAGPGTISITVALAASAPSNSDTMLILYFTGVALAAVLVALIVGMAYASAGRVVAVLGQTCSRVITRLAAFILFCVGVQILSTGVLDALTSLAARG